jgi:diguanylate cyclase (GGDEF)-like protein
MQLSTPTIQIVVLANFFALSIAWSYVARNYPDLNAARFWRASSFAAVAAAAISLLRGVIDPLVPVVIGNGLTILASCLALAGIRRFHGRSVPWRASALILAVTAALLVAFLEIDDVIAARVVIVSLAQIAILAWAARELRDAREAGPSPGANLASIMVVILLIAQSLRAFCAFTGIGGPISLVNLNGAQALGFLALLFASMMVNFGFLLMAVDRLRSEVAALAMVDDLTGVANRRHFLVRLADACAYATRTTQPLALLIIDLDRFKEINDGHGHGAGDACLRAFTRAAQARLRDSDLLARTGGDEFCVILPATTLNEAAMVARDLVKTCRRTRAHWNGEQIAMTASIGVAEWSREVGLDFEMLITAADQALYAAKRQGRDRLALPELEPAPISVPLPLTA